jgi:mycobactin polyketide synthetase MbtD
MSVSTWPDGRIPVLLSAHAPDLVGEDAAAIARHLRTRPDTGVADVAGQLLRTRRLRRHRAVLRAADREELLEGLLALAAGEDHPLVARSAEHTTPRLAFVCPGQGSQWPAMGSDAYTHLPAYRAEADKCAAAFTAAGLTSPLRYLTTAGDPDSFAEIEIQGAQFVHAVALAAVWRSCGVAADLTVGHSLGEIAAAYLAGVITLPDAVAVVGARAGVTDRMRGRYAVAALGLTAAAAEQLIAETPGWLELSVINASASVAVSGDRGAVATAVATVSARGGFAREITVNFPVHTSVLEPLREDFTAALPRGRFGDGPMQFIGGATGDVVAAGTEFGDYWYGNLRNMVRFARPPRRCDAAQELSSNCRRTPHCSSRSATPSTPSTSPRDQPSSWAPDIATRHWSTGSRPTSPPPRWPTPAIAGPISPATRGRCATSPTHRCARRTCGWRPNARRPPGPRRPRR